MVWLKFIYPKLSDWIEKIPKKMGTIICNILVVFMIANMLISALALARYTERNDASYSVETTELNGLQRFLDDHYPAHEWNASIRMRKWWINLDLLTMGD